MRHPLFISRTVLVKENNVEQAMLVLNKILGREGVIKDAKLLEYYEKPHQTRRRINYERCKAVIDEDTDRKINFLLRKHRIQAYPGCY